MVSIYCVDGLDLLKICGLEVTAFKISLKLVNLITTKVRNLSYLQKEIETILAKVLAPLAMSGTKCPGQQDNSARTFTKVMSKNVLLSMLKKTF